MSCSVEEDELFKSLCAKKGIDLDVAIALLLYAHTRSRNLDVVKRKVKAALRALGAIKEAKTPARGKSVVTGTGFLDWKEEEDELF